VGWLNDPEVVRYSEQRHRRHTLESCREYLRSFSGTPHYFWAITVGESLHDHIGNVNAYVDIPNQVADVGIMIGEREAWNQGYGLEAWQAVCNYLLNDVGIRKVTAGTLVVNLGMLAIMKNIGMVEDGRRSRHYLFEGRETDTIHFALYQKKSKKSNTNAGFEKAKMGLSCL